MSDIKADVSGFDKLIAEEPDKLDKWLRGIGNAILSDIVLSFGTSPAGRKYKRGRVTHVASQAGNPPNVDIGTLKASMRLDKKGDLHYEVSDGVEYGIHLEEGTQTVEPRPFLGPVFMKYRNEITGKGADDLEDSLTSGL